MSKLFFVALACLIAVVAADTTQIQVGYYTDSACSTPAFTGAVANHTSGDCFYNAALYSQSADNTQVYIYSYKQGTTGCPVANITGVSAVQVGVCGAQVSSYFTKYTIFTGATNPAAPTAFPPTGFTSQTQYVNTTGASADNTCSSSVTVVSAAPAPAATSACQKTNDDTQSVQAFLDDTCTTSVYVQYSDATCTTMARATKQTVEFKACNYGIKSTCTGTGLPDLTGLEMGFTQYDNNQCAANSNTEYTTSNGGCYGGAILTCSQQNNTQFVTYTQYANKNCSGDVRNTLYVTPDTCITSGNPQVINVTAFCTGGGSGGNSAAAASVSAIVMIVAAFVALVAGRQL